ncbi:repeat domain (List_Bact_rpt) [Ruminococcaceae bacterium FB2012]|nr:repeat domain (List_Bact_rpt) [Ruminococcaceae bacterium FB2012]
MWFGEYNGNPLKFRVLDPKSEDFGGKTMLLDCDTVIDFKEYQSDNYAEAGKKWDTCELWTWLNRNFFNMFPIYKLTYDANGGVGEMKEKRVIPNLNKFNLDKCTFTYKDGYHFKNWNTAADGSGNSYDDCASITLEGNTTLYAQWALDPVTYISEDGTEKTLTEYTLVESSDTVAEWNGGFYVVKGDVTINDTVNISKDSSLVLCDGAKLTVTGSPNGIDSTKSNLNIYGQSGQTGKLITTATVNCGMLIGGMLNIYGGDITASGISKVE